MIREYTEAIFYALIIALVVRYFVVQAFKIPTGSMEPTLHGAKWGGDKILVNKLIYRFKDPKRGDIVVFSTQEIPGLNSDQSPFKRFIHKISGLDMSKAYIKRLVGLPGDRVTIKNRHLYVNGKRLEDPDIFAQHEYVNTDFQGGDYGRSGQVIEVPPEHYYVLGDNSRNSRDSRYWGFVPHKNLKGKAVVVYWPPSRIRKLR